jgi:hypothetical protein
MSRYFYHERLRFELSSRLHVSYDSFLQSEKLGHARVSRLLVLYHLEVRLEIPILLAGQHIAQISKLVRPGQEPATNHACDLEAKWAVDRIRSGTWRLYFGLFLSLSSV